MMMMMMMHRSPHWFLRWPLKFFGPPGHHHHRHNDESIVVVGGWSLGLRGHRICIGSVGTDIVCNWPIAHSYTIVDIVDAWRVGL